MKIKSQNVLTFLLLIMLPGCVTFSTPTGQGLIFTDQDSPFAVVDKNVPSGENLKIGRAECFQVLGLFSYGDCSIHSALENGGISRIHYIDKEVNSLLLFGSSTITVIYGE